LALINIFLLHICTVDCKWTQWSNCSKSCGPGTIKRKIDIPANFGGQNCTGSDTDKCNIKDCPGKPFPKHLFDFLALINILFLHICSVDCKWTQWSNCSKNCGPGTITRTIDIQAKFGGQNCTGNDTDSCNIKECPGESFPIYFF
jgi:hypothetical protein